MGSGRRSALIVPMKPENCRPREPVEGRGVPGYGVAGRKHAGTRKRPRRGGGRVGRGAPPPDRDGAPAGGGSERDRVGVGGRRARAAATGASGGKVIAAMEQDFEIISEIAGVDIIAVGNAIRDLPRLVKSYGAGGVN
jgi:hypothetical protein